MSGVDVYVARQAIFDQTRHVHGYELLFRSLPGQDAFDGTESGLATTRVLADSLLAIGLDNLVGGKRAFVNFGREILLDDWQSQLPREAAVIELLETVPPDAEVLDACRRLRQQGYRLALDDFVFRPEYEPLLEVANLVKVDIDSLPRPEQAEQVRTYRARGLTMLAEKVETYEQFEWAKSAGYDLFQGYFFARPVIMHAKQIPAVKVHCIQLLREALRPELDFVRLERLIRSDVSLSYKLLRYVNSALFARPNRIQSLRQALSFLSDSDIRKWVALAALPIVATDKPPELMTQSVVRARMNELLAPRLGAQPQEAFLLGLLSFLDALTDQPLEQALAAVNVSEEIGHILLRATTGQNALASLHHLVEAYEVADWDRVETLSREKFGMEAAEITGTYLDAVAWARDAIQGARDGH